MIKEEYGSAYDIMRQSFTYVMTSKRRLLKVVIYAIYLYLFFKRFAFIIKYFRNSLRSLLSSWLDKISIGDSAIGLHRRLAGKSIQKTKVRFVTALYRRVVKAVLFMYNAFILVQLCCIGYAESFRIKNMVKAMLNSVKSIRIKDQRN